MHSAVGDKYRAFSRNTRFLHLTARMHNGAPSLIQLRLNENRAVANRTNGAENALPPQRASGRMNGSIGGLSISSERPAVQGPEIDNCQFNGGADDSADPICTQRRAAGLCVYYGFCGRHRPCSVGYEQGGTWRDDLRDQYGRGPLFLIRRIWQRPLPSGRINRCARYGRKVGCDDNAEPE